MRKLLFFALIGIMAMSCEKNPPIEIIAQGYCGAQGDNLTWVLTSDGVLTISGSGEMMNYGLDWIHLGNPLWTPWFHYELFTTVIIEYGVTSIGCNAFAGSWELISATIPSSVGAIGNRAFAHCYKLISINVDIENMYFVSENGVLFDKEKTILIHYPIGKSNTTYTIPNSVKIIGDYAFQDCRNLTSIIIPNSVTTIGNSAFRSCSNLSSVTIGNSVTSIGSSAFWGCRSLTSVTIPNSVTTIGGEAFAYCNNLTSVVIGNNVAVIEPGAFVGLDNLISAISYALNPPILKPFRVFRWWEIEHTTLYVPKESIELYRQAFGWQEFQNIVAIQD